MELQKHMILKRTKLMKQSNIISNARCCNITKQIEGKCPQGRAMLSSQTLFDIYTKSRELEKNITG